jgi:3'-phosphoadenosine 5'-phosphosulfate (PAPS) 3'-phosphatase
MRLYCARNRRVVEIVRRVIRDANNEQLLSWLERGSVGTGCRTWTLDPIDGTKGFLAGRQYVIALALIVDGVVHLAVIGCPRLSLVPTEGNVRIDEKSSNGGMAIALRGRARLGSGLGVGLKSRHVVMRQPRGLYSHSNAATEIRSDAPACCSCSEMIGPPF